jgi:hypothetical protein
MKVMSPGKIAIAISAFACTALLSLGWSEQSGISLSIESAQARVGRPLTPVSVAGVARRQNRRAAYGGGNYYGAGYFAASPWGDYDCRNPYGYPCNPYSSKDWWGTGTTAGYVARPYAGVGYYGPGPGYYGRPLARAAYYRATRY